MASNQPNYPGHEQGFGQPSYPPPHQQQPSYPPPYGGQYPPPSVGQYPPSGGQFPPPSVGQYPPPSVGQYPPPSVGQYPHPVAPPYPPENVGYNQPPITQQPRAHPQMLGPPDGWMSVPVSIPLNCPPGLMYLTTVDSLVVKQKVELLEAFIGFETNNKYTIKNGQGEKVFYGIEENDCCTRNCCGAMRPFNLKVMDNHKNEIIRIQRDLRCDSCWFPCCLQYMEVFSPPGNLIGTVQQTWSLCQPMFNIKNESGVTVLKIQGPICRYGICGDVEFDVFSKDMSVVVGKVSKKFGGAIREFFTDSDSFGISFPMDLDVRMKAVMLAACFLIDFMYFEKAGNQETDGLGMC